MSIRDFFQNIKNSNVSRHLTSTAYKQKTSSRFQLFPANLFICDQYQKQQAGHEQL